MASELGKRCDFHNEWTFWDGFQTLPKQPKPLRHQGRSGSTKLPEASKRPEFDPSDDHAEGPREETGRLLNPLQRRLSPTAIHDLIEAYRAGATISQIAVDFGIHRTTVTGHLDRHGIPRHSELGAWDDDVLRRAAEMYGTGSSLADVAHQLGADAQTVANRFRRAGIPVRPRRGWTSPAHSEQERR